MEQSFIHERVDRRMEPFYWILTFEVMTFLLVLSVAIIFGPIYLVWHVEADWAYVLVIFWPLAAWMGIAAFKYLRSYIRKNRLLNRYQLFEDRIWYRLHNHQSLAVHEETVLLEKTQRVYVSLYIAKYHYAYKKSTWREQQPYYHILPIIYIVYRDEPENRVLSIPFYEAYEAEIWLRELGNKNIPIWATDWLIAELPEKEQLQKLADEQHSSPFVLENNLLRELDAVFEQIREKTMKDNEEEKLEADTENKRSLWSKCIPRRSTVIIFALLFAAVALLVKIAEREMIPYDGAMINVILFLLAATVYLFLEKQLTIISALRFMAISIVGCLVVGINMAETDAGGLGEEYFISVIGVNMLMIAFIWIPYGVIWRIRRKRERERERDSR